MKSIKELTDFCFEHNLSIIYNRQRQHCGFKPELHTQYVVQI